MTTKKLPLNLENTHYSLYGNFGERFAAGFLDGIFLIPITMGGVYINSLHLYNYHYTFFVTQLLISLYSIYLPVRYGATPGRLIMGLTILKLDGSAITYRESFFKFLPTLLIGILVFVIQCLTIALADESVFDSLGWIEQTNYLKKISPIPMWVQMVVIYGYFLVTIIMVLTNPRKRSLSDQLAGTVVVYTRSLEKIKEYRKGLLDVK